MLRTFPRLTGRHVVGILLSVLTLAPIATGGTLSPTPQLLQYNGSTNLLPTSWNHCVLYNTSLALATADSFLAKYISGSTSCASAQVQIILHKFGTTPPATLPATAVTFPKMGTEGYILIVDKPSATVRVTVAANQEAGVWFGAMAALQLLLSDSGGKETFLRAQTIRDFPDHSVRGAHWGTGMAVGHGIQLTKVGSTYSFDDSAKPRIDFLLRHKVNRFFLSQPLLTFDPGSWTAGAAALRSLTDYCNARYLRVIPYANPIAFTGNDELNRTLYYESLDGWWQKERAFVYAPVDDEGMLFNGSLEKDWVDDGMPDGWDVNPKPYAQNWSCDRDTFFDGDAAMHLVQLTLPPNVPAFEQTVPVPAEIRALTGSNVLYVGLSAQLMWRSVQGNPDPFEVAIAAKDSTGALITPTGQTGPYRFFTTPGTSSVGGVPTWAEKVIGINVGMSNPPLTVDRNARHLYVRARMANGTANVRIDRLRLIQVTLDGSLWKPKAGVVPRQEIAAGTAQLLSNGGMESSGVLGLPASWSDTLAAGWGFTRNGVSRWSRDTNQFHSGAASAKLTIKDSLVANPNASGIILVQVVQGPISAGEYQLTGWAKTDWRNRCRPPTGPCDPDSMFFFPQLNMYTTVVGGAIGDSTSVLFDRNYRKTTDWCFYQATLKVPVQRDKIIVFSRILSPSYGTIWLDDVCLRQLPAPVPLKNLVPNGDMEACCDSIILSGSCLKPNPPMVPVGWKAPSWACLKSSASGAADMSWRMSTVAHSGSRSLKLRIGQAGTQSGSIAVGSEISGSFPVGRYLLSAWVRLDSLGTGAARPQITFFPTGTYGPHCQSLKASSISIDAVTAGWKEFSTILNVVQPIGGFALYSRLGDGLLVNTGVMYMDDVSIRLIDGSPYNLLVRGYRPQVKAADTGIAYADTAYDFRRALLSSIAFDVRAAPSRIVRKASGGIPESKLLKVSYDSHLYWNPTRVWEQGFGYCSLPIINNAFVPSVRRILTGAFSANVPRGILLPPTEIRGFNRSGACRGSGGQVAEPNATLLSDYVNVLVDSVRRYDTTAPIYNWSDMWSRSAFGGDPFIQECYGDSLGRTSDAITNQALNSSVRIINWEYYPYDVSARAFASRTFKDNGYGQLQAAWFDTLAMTETTALSISIANETGAVATAWSDFAEICDAQPSIPCQNDYRGMIRGFTDRMWNTPWRQIFFADFNPLSPPSGILMSAPNISVSSTDSTPPFFPTGFNRGVIKILNSGDFVVPKVRATKVSQYRLILQARDGSKSLSVRPRWYFPNGTSTLGSATVQTVGGAGYTYPYSGVGNLLNRYVFSLATPSGTTGPESLRVEVTATQASSTTLLDNVSIWETLYPCAGNDQDVVVSPLNVDFGETPSPYEFTFTVQNKGCRDIQVTSLATLPNQSDVQFNPTAQFIVPAGTTVTVYVTGTAHPGFHHYEAQVTYRLATPPTSPQTAIGIFVTYTGM